MADKTFFKKLRKAAESIRKDANGKVCGTCMYARESWCSENLNIEGEPLTILYSDAPACRDWSPLHRH